MSAQALREAHIEQRLVSRCREEKILCLKFTSPGRSAVPDRILIGTDAAGTPRVVFTEVKRPGQLPRPDQTAMLALLHEHGALTAVVSTYEEVEQTLIDFFLDPDPDRIDQSSPPQGRTGALVTGI